MKIDLERAAEAEEETIRQLRKQWEEQKAREAREAAWEAQNKRKAMLAQAIDYINILGPDRREREPQLKEILRQHEAAKRMGDWDSAATVLIEFWKGKIAEHGEGLDAPEIARRDIARRDIAKAAAATPYTDQAIEGIQDPTEYPYGYRTASQIRDEKAARRRGGIGGRS